MPRPDTVHDLVDLVRRSRLVDEPRLDAFAAALAADAVPEAVLGGMVGDGLLTPFQAAQIGAGQWRGFALGEYRLLDRIAAGGMGTVYLAAHARTGARVAVKVLNARLAADAVARERFAREARAAAALSHPNIVHVHTVDVDSDPPFLVMDYIDGVSLQAAVARTGTFAAGTAAYCGRQIALGLQRALEVGIVHRDIKPANLVVDRTGLVKILDLGIVRLESAAELTRTVGEQHILGTADYLAPEQAVDSHDVDIRADIYALGCTLYFLLAGHPPFPDGTAQDKVYRKQIGDAPAVEGLRPDLPPGLCRVIQRMLARDPRGRFPTPLACAEALAPFATPDARFPRVLFSVSKGTEDDEGTPTTTGGDRRRAEFGSPTGLATLHAPAATAVTLPTVPEVYLPREPLTPWVPVTPPPVVTVWQTVPPELIDRRPQRDPVVTWMAASTAGAAAVAVGSVFGLWAWKKSQAERVPPPPPAAVAPAPAVATFAQNVLVVSRAGPHTSIAAALAAARPGQRVEVWDDVWEEQLTVPMDVAPDVTLTGRPGRPVLWRPPATPEPGRPLLDAGSGTGLEVGPFAFHGGGRVDVLVRLAGTGRSLERCELRGARRAAVQLAGPGSPEVSHCRFVADGWGGAAVELGGAAVLTDCRIEGRFAAAVRLVGATDGAAVVDNRVLGAARGVEYAPATGRPPAGVTVARNVFAEVGVGVSFAAVPAGPGPSFDGNVFADVPVTSELPAHATIPATGLIWWDDHPTTPGTRHFRGGFELPDVGPPVPAVLEVRAGRYSVWVNGHAAAANRCPGEVAERIDLTPYLRPGRNVIAIQAAAGPGLAPPGLLAVVRAGGTEGEIEHVLWHVDRTDEPSWYAPGFDAAEWLPAVVWAGAGRVASAADWPFPCDGQNLATGETVREGVPPLGIVRLPLPMRTDPSHDDTFLRPDDADLPAEWRGRFGPAR